jgi:hypothetical protein
MVLLVHFDHRSGLHRCAHKNRYLSTNSLQVTETAGSSIRHAPDLQSGEGGLQATRKKLHKKSNGL